jgi:glutathione S-transferase
MTTRLVTIPFSHYCEKARWALDVVGVDYVEEGHLPIFHMRAVKRAGGTRTVPLLVDGTQVVADSTPIVAWADARQPGALLPIDAVDRTAALQLEDDFDLQLGPATRRWAYFHLLDRKDLMPLLGKDVPRWEASALRATRPAAVAMLKRQLKLDRAGAERSRAKIDAAFDRVSELLADGRRFLVGNRFSVADLTFAALAAPVLMPPEHPVTLPPASELPDEARAHATRWATSPAGQHARRIYATERRAA